MINFDDIDKNSIGIFGSHKKYEILEDIQNFLKENLSGCNIFLARNFSNYSIFDIDLIKREQKVHFPILKSLTSFEKFLDDINQNYNSDILNIFNINLTDFINAFSLKKSDYYPITKEKISALKSKYILSKIRIRIFLITYEDSSADIGKGQYFELDFLNQNIKKMNHIYHQDGKIKIIMLFQTKNFMNNSRMKKYEDLFEEINGDFEKTILQSITSSENIYPKIFSKWSGKEKETILKSILNELFLFFIDESLE